jgi:hypothetical protein
MSELLARPVVTMSSPSTSTTIKTASAQLKEVRFGEPLGGTSRPTVFVADGFDLQKREPDSERIGFEIAEFLLLNTVS